MIIAESILPGRLIKNRIAKNNNGIRCNLLGKKSNEKTKKGKMYKEKIIIKNII